MRWPNELCEPVLITYNRAQELEKTLAAFAELKDRHLILHVLDNCSTDQTPAVVAAWQKEWPGLRYHRNAYNIGGNANILRALELTQSYYSWVIGDDDVWHMTHIDEVITALHTQKAAVIRLGWLVAPEFAGKKILATTLFQQETFFFASLSMISATMVRRDIMTRHLNWAYQNICYAYPQLVPLIRELSDHPMHVYSVKQALITHTPSQAPGYFVGDLEWYVAWFRTARFFKDRKHREAFMAEAVRYMIRPAQGKGRELVWLLKVALNAKAQGISQWRYLFELWQIGHGWRLRLCGLSLIYLSLPKFLARGLRRLYFYIRKKEWKEMQYDQSRL
ncbi:MAG: glycosyltransferase [Legionellales bacterium]|nr:glycosyltransferase [Legionellales bacterium]